MTGNPFDKSNTPQETADFIIAQAQTTTNVAGAMNAIVSRAVTAAQTEGGANAIRLTRAALIAADALGVDHGESLAELEAKNTLALASPPVDEA